MLDLESSDSAIHPLLENPTHGFGQLSVSKLHILQVKARKHCLVAGWLSGSRTNIACDCCILTPHVCRHMPGRICSLDKGQNLFIKEMGR